jgi:hypothetical protein
MAVAAALGLGAAGASAEPGWYEFEATSTAEPGEIGMAHWLETPAGKHGRPRIDGDRFVYNGQPLKLWGLNNSYRACAPDRETADRRAAFYAKMGINAVRLHKYADGTGWRGINTPRSFVEFEPDLLDRMDYFVAAMKEAGIYTKLSPSFGIKLGPDDRTRLTEYYDELRGRSDDPDRWPRVPYGAVYFAPEWQDLAIEQMLLILGHENPHTGMRYVDDPAIACIEIINEDSVLWWGTGRELQRSDFLRQRSGELFGEWLREKYGDHAGLVEAWGEAAIDAFVNDGMPAGENLDDNTVLPFAQPWFTDPDNIAGNHPHAERRLLDTMRFLYELQNDFYDRFVVAVTEAGWEGPIVASNWQAGEMASHYYNLHSDARIGVVDRHNYFGGGYAAGRGEAWNNDAMLSTPGSAMLSAGMQQVKDRPFMLSEWIHVYPNEWAAEGPALIGAYGMGLNGWDASYLFQNGDRGGFSHSVGRDWWDATSPSVVGLFPAISRQVLRGDVTESELLAPRNVHIDSLIDGKLDFNDRVTQQHDTKSFDSDKVPVASLAAARVVIDFTDSYQSTPAFPLEDHREGDAVVSNTGELSWTGSDEPHGGFFTMDTDATKALVGFAQGKSFELGDVSISSDSRFGAFYVTAQEPETTLADSKRWIVVAIGRVKNTGFELTVKDGETFLTERGEPPVLVEALKATIESDRSGGTVRLLDHDGLPTDRTRPFDGRLVIDGEADRTPYYLIEFD